MGEGLREFDTTVGRCNFCGKMVLREEATLSFLNTVSHRKCENKYQLEMCRI